MCNVISVRIRIGPVVCVVTLCAGLVSVRPAASVQQRYDLGGPCEEQSGWNKWGELGAAERARDWDHVVALQREVVRAGCNNEYGWYGLVDALLKARRPEEASSVLQEMDARGFDINPALIEDTFPQIVGFMRSKEFTASALALKIKRLESISDERRAKFQVVLSRMPPSEKPPENYVAKGVCPFECCRYGTWTVLQDTELVSNPGSSRIVGKAGKGSRVVGVTGEVHLRPEPVLVLVDGPLPKNTIAFTLDYVGEGYGNVYTHGKVVFVETYFGYARYCFRPSQSCWGETLLPSGKGPEAIWWVKIQLADGTVGWTDKTNNFGGKDACA